MGDTTSYPKPSHRLANRVRARFGNPHFLDKVRWAPWEDDESWRVSAAWVQHRVAQQLNRVLEGDAQPACELTLDGDAETRLAQVASFCGMGTGRLNGLMKGYIPIRMDELVAWLAVTGIDPFPVIVEELLPDERLTDLPVGGGPVRRVTGRGNSGDD